MALTKVQVILALLLAFIISFTYTSGFRKLLQLLLYPYVLTFLCGLVLPRIVTGVILRAKGTSEENHDVTSTIYGLDHGRLHLEIPPAMWMNMGYWHQGDNYELGGEAVHEKPEILAIACKNLLAEVLKTAGFDGKRESATISLGTRRSKCLIDFGFGCGDQTIYLASEVPIRPSDRAWWDCRDMCEPWDYYVGATLDKKQFQFAEQRVQEFQHRGSQSGHKAPSLTDVKLFCENGANPKAWSEGFKANIATALTNTHDHWVLALDTLYHFSPSRWPVIKHFAHLESSFMAFDLCLSSQASLSERIILRILTTIMGAPWANFVTVEQYRGKLIEAGYLDSNITIKDISSHVFEPLAAFLEAQDRKLRVIGYRLGSFRVAQWMFAWWGRSGVVKGIIVVAKR